MSHPEKTDGNANPRGSIRSAAEWIGQLAAKTVAAVVFVALCLAVLSAAQRRGWFDGNQANLTNNSDDPNSESQLYICPMMCTPPSQVQGRCPVCGMDLVAASRDIQGDGQSVTIEPAARRIAGIKTAVSETKFVERSIRTVGAIDFDASRLATISAYFDGRIEEMFADYVGVPVSKGDDLALIYSPKLFTAQTEFVTSLDSEGGGRLLVADQDLLAMANEKLLELGMTSDQIAELRRSKKPQSRIRIKSPQQGTVIERSALEGDYVETGQRLFQIADLTTVWLMLDLFPDDAAVVRFGQVVTAEVQSHPGEVFRGRVSFIDPVVDPTTRTVRVRVEISNPDRKLKPGDYATARIDVPAIATEQVYDPELAGKYISPMHPQIIRGEPGPCPRCGMELVPTTSMGFSAVPLPQQKVVTVPRNAVLLAGNDGVVYVETEPGRFEIRRVKVGPTTQGEAVIIDGLEAGEIVATEGNFLIDSQMQLSGNPSILDPTRASTFSSGPLELLSEKPARVIGTETGQILDNTFEAYFAIQTAMAADRPPPEAAIKNLRENLTRLEKATEIPLPVQADLGIARRSAARLNQSLDDARGAFRTVSRSLLRAASEVRGPQTATKLKHFHCPMVVGNGGDWMQADGEIANPYFGSQMLRCGVLVSDMKLPSQE